VLVLLLLLLLLLQEKRARFHVFHKALRHGVILDFENMDDPATKYLKAPSLPSFPRLREALPPTTIGHASPLKRLDIQTDPALAPSLPDISSSLSCLASSRQSSARSSSPPSQAYLFSQRPPPSFSLCVWGRVPCRRICCSVTSQRRAHVPVCFLEHILWF